jgi:DNA-binding transcriptional LysR family regulator
LVTLPVSTPKLASRTIFAYRDLALCAPGHPLAEHATVTLKQLLRFRLLLLPLETRSRMLLERDLSRARAGAATAAAATVMELGSVHLQKAFARIGLGVAIAPDYAVRSEVAAGEIRAIAVKDLSPRRIGVIQRDRRSLSPAAQSFLSMLVGNPRR